MSTLSFDATTYSPRSCVSSGSNKKLIFCKERKKKKHWRKCHRRLAGTKKQKAQFCCSRRQRHRRRHRRRRHRGRRRSRVSEGFAFIYWDGLLQNPTHRFHPPRTTVLRSALVKLTSATLRHPTSASASAMADHNDNRLLGNANEPKASIIKRPENVGLINNKFKKVNILHLLRATLCLKFLDRIRTLDHRSVVEVARLRKTCCLLAHPRRSPLDRILDLVFEFLLEQSTIAKIPKKSTKF